MSRITRRTLLIGAATLPHVALAQSDTRPSIAIAVQAIATSNTLDIINEASNVGTLHYDLYTEPLIETDWTGDLALKPGLAESWSRIDDRTVEFRLRPNVRFHNGQTLTAEDVAWTFGPRMFGTEAEQHAAQGAPRDPSWAPPKVRAGARNAYPNLERMEIVNPLTVRWVNRTPDITIEGRASMRSSVILPASVGRAATNWYDWARHPIGTGPYRVADYQPENSLTLEAFNDYWGGRPPLRRIRFVQVPELASRINGLLAGDYDFACDVTPDQIPVVAASQHHETVGGLIANVRVLDFDEHFLTLANPLMRRALTHAIDRQAIVDSVWGGRTQVTKGLQFEFYGPMFLADWAAPAYDPALARSLAQQAGYRGEAIPFRVLNNYYTNQVPTSQILAQMFQSAGLNVQIQMEENWSQVEGTNVVRALNDNSMTAFFNDPMSVMPVNFGPKSSFVVGGYWRNAEVEQLLGVMETSTDLAPRRAAFRRMLEIVERDDPAITVLHQTANFTAKRKDIAWKPSKAFVMEFRAGNFALRTA